MLLQTSRAYTSQQHRTRNLDRQTDTSRHSGGAPEATISSDKIVRRHDAMQEKEGGKLHLHMTETTPLCPSTRGVLACDEHM